MKNFMDEDFLLETETERKLFHEYAEKMPVVDYHCHLSPKEIYEDHAFSNITELWLGGDHYKWRQMRSNGVAEKYITGDGSDRDKFQAWAKTLSMAVGNPLYHWSHLELQRYFGYTGYLCGDTAEEVWNLANRKLQDGSMTARQLVANSNVKLVVTTDDPVDSLEYHEKMAKDSTMKFQVLPAWRPEKAMNVEKPDWPAYIDRLAQVSETPIRDFNSFMDALRKRMDFFASRGCTISDHSLEYVHYKPASETELNAIFVRAIAGQNVNIDEERQFKTMMMLLLGREYANKNWVMQLHFGVQRNLNKKIYQALGADAGIDAINSYANSIEMGQFLNALAETDQLPKTILYSLNPAENAAIGSVIGCFQDSSIAGKVQQGSAWWFNDHKTGMMEQMTSLANLGLLGNFNGMLTDSRSFISYPRHEYFRRILCHLIGGWVENGEYPADWKTLERIIKGISYNNAVRYFGFQIDEEDRAGS